jgi:hypothetical protein
MRIVAVRIPHTLDVCPDLLSQINEARPGQCRVHSHPAQSTLSRGAGAGRTTEEARR